MTNRRKKISRYLRLWKGRGYPEDIPDEVPAPLADRCLAPSYKAIAVAILKNDHALLSLGFQPPPSETYSAIKREELKRRSSELRRDEPGKGD